MNIWGACGRFLHYKMGEKAGRRRIFTILSKAKELPQRELQDILGICSGSLSEILAKMEPTAFWKGQEQNRRQAAESAADGSRQKEAVEQEKDYQRRVRRMVACLSREEQESLLKMLTALAECWWDLDQNREEQGAIVSGDSGERKKEAASNVYHFGMRVSICSPFYSKIGKEGMI